ncbi:MAG: hypothetical protein ACPGQS_07665 [Bradymonadia bacterium]
MNQELLILDPKGSSSMLEPIMVVDLLLSSPSRWVDGLDDFMLGGVCCLPSSSLRTVLNEWALQRGLSYRVAAHQDNWLGQIGAVLVFDEQTRREGGELLAAFGVPVIYFDLQKGTFVSVIEDARVNFPLGPSSPKLNTEIDEVENG